MANIEERLVFIRRKLFTNHDRWNIHKILGGGCLLHFLYRFCQAGPSDMGFRSDWLTLFCIAWHTLLSASSMIFHIPMKRLREGSMIWPEYRLHSITFALRSLCCMLIVWFESRYSVGPYYIANVFVVFATLKLASLGSESAPSGTKLDAGGTIRDLDAPLNMRTFFSVLQFHATVGCLYGLRRYSTQFMYVWIIQFTAFLLTLRRKNLAPHMALVTTYGFMLMAGFVISTYEIVSSDGWEGFLILNAMANGSAFLRMVMRIDKYLLWLGFTAITFAVRTAPPAFSLLVFAYVLSIIGVVRVFQHAKKRATRDSSENGRKELQEGKEELEKKANGSRSRAMSPVARKPLEENEEPEKKREH